MLAAHIAFAHRTSDWQRSGFEVVDNAVSNGEPVIMTLWHQRLAMAPFLFDRSLGEICSLTSSARAGRLAGEVLGRFGFDTVPMSSHRRHVALSRAVLGKIREGKSIGVAVDGPRGPARQASTVPLVWARSSGCRVFCVSFSASRVLTLPTWDQMMLPMPWTKGVLLCREWNQTVPRKLDEFETEALRLKLEATLNAITDESDRATGRLAA
nr:DUF374 domain-containing protein [Pontibaca salina]